MPRRKGGNRRSDLIRLREILGILIEPYEGSDLELTTEAKLYAVFRTENYPIYKRKITKRMPVHGLWWMNESEWARFLWQGHQATVLKTDQDPDRVLATRTFDKGWCYVREVGERFDLEAIVKTTKWCPIKKKRLGDAYEWLTVSITKEEYDNLNDYMGPKHEGCKHHRHD